VFSRAAFACLAVGALYASAAGAATLGMASDPGLERLSVFDANLDTVTASLDGGPGPALGDCVISADERLGVSSSNNSEITFIDLGSAPSGPAQSGARLPISNLGVDLALSPDDAWLVLAGGGGLQQPLSVVDTATRSEISTTALFADNTSVEFCDNGTLLVTTINGAAYGGQADNALYDAGLDSQGRISLLGHRLSSGAQPNNTACAPGSLAGVLLDREGGVTSFTLPDLEPVSNQSTGAAPALAAAFSADGRQLYVRSSHAVHAYQFNPVTGQMSLAWEQDAPETSSYFGMELIALHPNGEKLYVDGGRSMLVLDAASGLQAGAIESGGTSGICFANRPAPALPGLRTAQEPRQPAP
jgi:DNA-binding beta-propeller fold protein YncE